MLEWLWRLTRSVSGEPAPSRDVMRALRIAERKNLDVWVTSLDGGDPLELSGHIISVRRDCVHIHLERPAARALPADAPVRLSINTSNGRLVGRTRILTPREKSPGHEWVIAVPDQLQAFNRRAVARTTLGGSLHLDVELHAAHSELAEPIRGTLGTITAHRAVIRARNARDRLAIGDRLYFKTLLPEPVGEVGEMAEVEQIDFEPSCALIYVRFASAISSVALAAAEACTDSRQVA